MICLTVARRDEYASQDRIEPCSPPNQTARDQRSAAGARKELGEAEQFVIFIDGDEDAAE